MAAIKSIIRSSSLRSAAAKTASKPKPAPYSSSPSFRLPKSPSAPRIIRSPIETSFCIESLLPMHSATASALMASMLSLSRGGYGRIVEVDSSRRPRTKKVGKSRFSMLSPLHFHYEDVLRQDLLLKLNCDNIMQVPGLCEVRLAPKESTSSALTVKFGKLAMEILGGQRYFKAKRGPTLQARKSSRPEAFMGSDKDAGVTRQGTLRGEEMTNFLVRALSVMSMLDSPFEVRENSIKFSMGTEFCQSSPELEDHFEFFEQIRAFNVTITTSALTKEETKLLWSGLLNDEGESK